MCFVVAVFTLIFAIDLFTKEMYVYASVSVAVSMFFVYLMIRNIIFVKKMKEKTKELE